MPFASLAKIFLDPSVIVHEGAGFRNMSDMTGALLTQLSYCLSVHSRIKAYLMKGKGLLLSKLPGTTAMRPLSEVREDKVDGFSRLCLATMLQHPTERIRLPVPLCWVCRFTKRCLHSSQECSRQMSFTRALP